MDGGNQECAMLNVYIFYLYIHMEIRVKMLCIGWVMMLKRLVSLDQENCLHTANKTVIFAQIKMESLNHFDIFFTFFSFSFNISECIK